MALIQHDSLGNQTIIGSTSVVGDTLPIDTIVEYDGETVPSGWIEVSNSGTWTPRLEGSTVAGTATYIVQTGTYAKFGNILVLDFKIGVSSMSGGTGLLTIKGYESLGTAPTSYAGVGHIVGSGAFYTNDSRIWNGQGLIVSDGSLGGIAPPTISGMNSYLYGTVVLITT